MHQGIDLLEETDPAALEKAVRCFDRAIALRRTLPLEEEPFFRYGLSAGWINRGDALARLGGGQRLNDAVHSYDEALALLESLPLAEKVLYPRRLAITRINRGVALQQQEPSRDREAAVAFRAALDVLADPSAEAVTDLSALRAMAWANLAGAAALPDEAFSAVREALGLTRAAEQADAAMAETGLKARHALCRRLVRDFATARAIPDPLVAEATDAVEEGLALAREWETRGRADFDGVARNLFHFGCWIYGNRLPRFLAEFLGDSLDWEDVDRERAAAAVTAIQDALALIQNAGDRSDLMALEKRLQAVLSA